MARCTVAGKLSYVGLVIFCLAMLCAGNCGAAKVQDAWILFIGDGAEAWLNGHPVWTWVTQTARIEYPPLTPVTTTAKSISPDFFSEKNILCIKNFCHVTISPGDIQLQYFMGVVLDNGKTLYFGSDDASVDDTKLLHQPDNNINLFWTNEKVATLGYLTNEDITNQRMEPFRDFEELGPKNWQESDFDDTGWKDTIYVVPPQLNIINPDTSMGVGAVSSFKDGLIDKGVLNVIDYYRRSLNLPIEATPKTDPNPVPITTP